MGCSDPQPPDLGGSVLLINDIAGYGKVGMAAMLPVLSYMGIPAFCMPTALVSNTLDYGEFTQMDTTEYMQRTFPIWQRLGFHFDAISTGLMFNPQQAELVQAYCREQAEQGCIIFVDPVMGDGGRLYNGITQQQVVLMRRMVGVAHLAKPNYTEACYLCGVPFRREGISRDEARRLLDSIIMLGAHSTIITSCIIEGKNMVCGYDADANEYFFHQYEEIPGLFHGTGDIFSAVLIGSLLGQGKSLPDSTRRAMDVVSQMIDRNRDVKDHCCGIFIERCLDLL
jgi:pyridoxine kinase